MKLQGFEYEINDGNAIFLDQPLPKNSKIIIQGFTLEPKDDIKLPDGSRWLWLDNKFTLYEGSITP